MEPSDIHEHLVVETSRTVTGALRNGTTVRNGAQLTVYGAVSGSIHVEIDSILMAQGSFTGSIETSDGTILLYGQVDIELDEIVGNVAIGIGSLLTTRHGSFRLLPDGELEELTASHHSDGSFQVHTDRVCYFDAKTATFQPLSMRS